MLTLSFGGHHRTCDGMTRRNFLRVGSLGVSGLTLPTLLQARAEASAARKPLREMSTVWLWLGGGPTHVETFDPKPDAPSEFRSVVGHVGTRISGIQIGALFPRIADVADHMTFVRSFAHSNSGHGGGTHYVMTGHDFPPADQGEAQIWPSFGSIVAAAGGITHPRTGMPRYVAMRRIYGDGAAFLGVASNPFEAGGESLRNMQLAMNPDRLADRRTLLSHLDRMNRATDRQGLMEGMDRFEHQAFDLILGPAKRAFDLSQEDPRVRDRYGPGLGEQLLVARRLCEQGVGFVTVNYDGWDMHTQIAQGLRARCPQLDHAVSAFVTDCAQRGLGRSVLLVITGEFGRTPRVNAGAGRDHWAPLSALAIAGGGLRVGQVIGESSAKAETPRTTPVSPQDLMATVYHVHGLDPDMQFVNQAGRPVSPLYGGKPIAELV